jgi:hypothetical protein
MMKRMKYKCDYCPAEDLTPTFVEWYGISEIPAWYCQRCGCYFYSDLTHRNMNDIFFLSTGVHAQGSMEEILSGLNRTLDVHVPEGRLRLLPEYDGDDGNDDDDDDDDDDDPEFFEDDD